MIGHDYLYNIVMNINNGKNLTNYLRVVGGDLLLISIEIRFFNFWKITVGYLTKFTNASYENILLTLMISQ